MPLLFGFLHFYIPPSFAPPLFKELYCYYLLPLLLSLSRSRHHSHAFELWSSLSSFQSCRKAEVFPSGLLQVYIYIYIYVCVCLDTWDVSFHLFFFWWRALLTFFFVRSVFEEKREEKKNNNVCFLFSTLRGLGEKCAHSPCQESKNKVEKKNGTSILATSFFSHATNVSWSDNRGIERATRAFDVESFTADLTWPPRKTGVGGCLESVRSCSGVTSSRGVRVPYETRVLFLSFRWTFLTPGRNCSFTLLCVM